MAKINNLDGVHNKKKQAPEEKKVRNYSPEEFGKILHEWKASEYEQSQKSKSWYITAGIVALILIGISVFYKNYLFLIVIVMLGIVVVIMDRKEPLRLDAKITNKGIMQGKRFYAYSDIESFWIIYDPPTKILNIRTTRSVFPEISIQLEDENPLEIRETLLNHIPENEEITEESPSARITRILKI